MYYVTFFVFLLTQTAFSQTELIDSILLDPSNYLQGNVTQIDHCASPNLNACELKNCVNGTYPPYGYTCQKPDNTLLQVDYVSFTVYEKINDFLTNTYQPPNPLVSLKDIRVDMVEVTLTYIYETSRVFGDFEASVFRTVAASAIRQNFASLVGFQIGSDRIVVDASTSTNILTIQIQFPEKSSWVSWTSSKDGEETTLADILLTDVGKNASSPGDKIRILVQYSNNTVYCKWLEDFSQPTGVDDTYLDLACESYGRLLNGTVDITPSGFALDSSSLTITDTACRYIPTTPPSSPTEPPANDPKAPSGSNSLVTGLWGFVFSFSLLSTFFHLIN